MTDDRQRKKPDPKATDSIIRRRSVALIRRYKELKDQCASLESDRNVLLDRTASQQEEIDRLAEEVKTIRQLLYGKDSDPKDGGLKATVERHSFLWGIVPTVGGMVQIVVTSLVTAGLVAWFGWNK